MLHSFSSFPCHHRFTTQNSSPFAKDKQFSSLLLQSAHFSQNISVYDAVFKGKLYYPWTFHKPAMHEHKSRFNIIFFTIKPVLSEKNGREQRILINSWILWHLFALLLILIVLTFNDVFCGTVDILQRNGSNPQVQCTVSEGKTLMEGKDFCFRCTSCRAELFNCYVMPWRQDGLHLCFPPYKAVAPGSPFFFRRRQRNVFLKTSHFHAYKALAPASPFFLLKATKINAL